MRLSKAEEASQCHALAGYAREASTLHARFVLRNSSDITHGDCLKNLRACCEPPQEDAGPWLE